VSENYSIIIKGALSMAYKLMAVDIDGTLFNSAGILTDVTKKAILESIDKGLIFTISTGRPLQGVEALNRMLNLDLPFITYNGAMVIMGKSKEVLYEQRLSAENAKEIIELAKKYQTTYMVWADNKLLVTEINDRVNLYKQISTVEPTLVGDINDWIKNGVTKILWYDEIENIDRFQSEVGRYLGNRVNYHTSRPNFLEFVDINASKAIAMEKIGEHFGIKQSEMIAIGDGYNDLSMIEYAGLGVVMANAKDAIKEKGDYITLSNDEDGVAHVIYKFVINA
jgi:Cof subfamily protein (haloacid dehalogenase superfamily)